MTKKTIGVTEAGVLTGLISFTFDDKTEQTFDVSKVNEQTKLRAMMHGFSQKIGDSYAGAAKAEGMTPLEYAKKAVQDTIAQLYANEWRAPSVAGIKVSPLAKALSRLTGKTLEESHAFVEGLSDEEIKVWKAKGKVKAMLTVIAAEEATARAQKLAAKVAAQETTEDESEEEEIEIPSKE